MDGPTWEQSDKLALRFNDEERTECTFMLHCEKKDCGEKYMYTGEDDTCPNDEMPNIFDGILCSDSGCPDCVPLREEDEASLDENDLVRYNLCTYVPLHRRSTVCLNCGVLHLHRNTPLSPSVAMTHQSIHSVEHDFADAPTPCA